MPESIRKFGEPLSAAMTANQYMRRTFGSAKEPHTHTHGHNLMLQPFRRLANIKCDFSLAKVFFCQEKLFLNRILVLQ